MGEAHLLFSAQLTGGEQQVSLLIMEAITDGYQMVDHLIMASRL